MNKVNKSSRKRMETRLKITHSSEQAKKPKKYNTFVSDPRSGTKPQKKEVSV